MNKITYHKEGDYLIPDLYLPKQPDGNIGKYGRLRLAYLKNFNRGLYNELLMTGHLKRYLMNIDKSANSRIDLLVKQFAEVEEINEDLKQTNQMQWVQAMNIIKNRAEEIVFNEIIYV